MDIHIVLQDLVQLILRIIPSGFNGLVLFISLNTESEVDGVQYEDDIHKVLNVWHIKCLLEPGTGFVLFYYEDTDRTQIE